MMRFNRAVWLFFILGNICCQAYATTVLEVTVSEMVNRSEMVFEGRVLTSEVQSGVSNRETRTIVTFEIIDIIKGNYPGDTIQLSFMGGTVGGRTLRVEGMHMPKIGEKGIYFVESLQRRQVHPFFGWSQGHFIVLRDTTGTERVFTRTSRVVQELEPGGTTSSRRFSKGVARGVKVDGRDALSVSSFKIRIRDMLQEAAK